MKSFIDDLNLSTEPAWERLYLDFYPALCSYSERIVKDGGVAEDIVQDCISGLWRKKLTFPDIKSLTAWLYRSVYTRSLNSIRDRNSASSAIRKIHAETHTADEETAIEAAVEEAVVMRLNRAIAMLSAQQRQIIEMTLGGLKVREIAQKLNVSDNTVKMQKKRAYVVMRANMGTAFGALLFSIYSHCSNIFS